MMVCDLVDRMPATEFDSWFIYLEWRAEEEKKAMKKAEEKAKAKSSVVRPRLPRR